jgi:hypothetical protein
MCRSRSPQAPLTITWQGSKRNDCDEKSGEKLACIDFRLEEKRFNMLQEMATTDNATVRRQRPKENDPLSTVGK